MFNVVLLSCIFHTYIHILLDGMQCKCKPVLIMISKSNEILKLHYLVIVGGSK